MMKPRSRTKDCSTLPSPPPPSVELSSSFSLLLPTPVPPPLHDLEELQASLLPPPLPLSEPFLGRPSDELEGTLLPTPLPLSSDSVAAIGVPLPEHKPLIPSTMTSSPLSKTSLTKSENREKMEKESLKEAARRAAIANEEERVGILRSGMDVYSKTYKEDMAVKEGNRNAQQKDRAEKLRVNEEMNAVIADEFVPETISEGVKSENETKKSTTKEKGGEGYKIREYKSVYEKEEYKGLQYNEKSYEYKSIYD